jgi:hypothetical protein
MPTLDASVAGSTSNSYVSVGVATALLDERLYTTAWLEADATDQAQALMWATQLLDEYCVWYGMPSTVTQALAWPQTGQRDARGQPIPATVIPEPVQRATATYALLLLEDAPPDPTTVEISAVKSRKVGDTQITYHDPQTQATAQATKPVAQGLPPEIRAMLKPFAQLSGGLTVRLLRT